jgi:hypothetical protein
MPLIVIRKIINELAARQSKDAVQEKRKREANGAKRGLAFQVFQ